MADGGVLIDLFDHEQYQTAGLDADSVVTGVPSARHDSDPG